MNLISTISNTRTHRSSSIAATDARATDELRLDCPSSPEAPARARSSRRNRRAGLLAGAALVALVATGCFPTGPVHTWVPDFNKDGRIDKVEIDRQKSVIVANVAASIEQDRRAKQSHPFLTCVRHHESDRGPWPHANGYGAQNPRSTASGAYQFLDSTWRNVSSRAGHGGYSKARYAPWYVQDAVALYLVNNGGRSAWNGSGC